MPTLPHGPSLEARNFLSVREALDRAGRAKIPVLIAGIGGQVQRLAGLAEDVRKTGGTIALAPGPAELDATVRRFAELLSDRFSEE